MTDLLPCPFCGDSIVEVYKRNGGYERGDNFYVYCHDCGLEFPGDHTFRRKEIAIEAWNKRVQKTPEYPSEPLAYREHRCRNCGHVGAIKIGSKYR